MKTLESTLERDFDAPQHLVWALVADTDRFDRASGLAPGRYAFRQTDPSDAKSRVRVAQASEMGLTIEWIEPPYDWVEGSLVEGERFFLKGPVQTGGFRVQLTPLGTHRCRVQATAFVKTDNPFGLLVAQVMRARFFVALRRYFDAIGTVLTESSIRQLKHDTDEPPQVAAKRVLIASRPQSTTSGVRSKTDEVLLDQRASQLGLPNQLVLSRLVEHLRLRPDEDVRQMRPFELAIAWQLPKREVLRAFIEATHGGLLTLEWQILCPVCRVSSGEQAHLNELERQGHCDACNIKFDFDFAQNVEATFTIHPAIRLVERVLYCASSPWFKPHVFAQLTVRANVTRFVRTVLPPGEVTIRSLKNGSRTKVEMPLTTPWEECRIYVNSSEIIVNPVASENAGETLLEIESESDDVVLIERSGWSADIVTGSVLLTMKEASSIFATEAPAQGIDISISRLCFLFTDLSGSTAAYQRLGDAKAFALVESHFNSLTALIQKHEGVVVKTMGDAVMAAFVSMERGAQAAKEMVPAVEECCGHAGLRLKIGLFEGPALLVRANERLDYFGSTVNLCARLQAQAHEGCLVMTEEQLTTLPNHLFQQFSFRSFRAELKGINGEQALVEIDLTPSSKQSSAFA